MVASKTKKATTRLVRLKVSTLDELAEFGEFKDSWDKCIQRLIRQVKGGS